jgi:hypothetical protein
MKAEELRIGNWVEIIDSKGIYTTVTKSTFDCDVDVFYKPIPITVDWLLKLGFDLINNEYHQSRNHDLKLHWTVNKNKMIPEFNEKRFVTGYDFKYVHQLQNLYFALTGEELICK